MSSIEAPKTPFSANTTRAASRIRWRVASRRAERGSSITIAGPLLSIHRCTRYVDVSDTRLYPTTRDGGTQTPPRPPLPLPPPVSHRVARPYAVPRRPAPCSSVSAPGPTGSGSSSSSPGSSRACSWGCSPRASPAPARPTRRRSCPPARPSKAAQEALERAFPGSTSASSATITLHRSGGLTAEDLAYRDAYAAWATSDEAPAELAGRGHRDRDRRLSPRARDAAPQRRRLVRDPRHQPRRRRRGRRGDGRRGAAPRASRRHDAGRPGDPRHGRGRDQLRLPRGGQGRHRQHDGRSRSSSSSSSCSPIYRAPLAALIPLITIGGAYVVSTGVLGFLAAAGWQVSSTLATFLVVMVFGVGTDYAIFLISRYREEVSSGGGTGTMPRAPPCAGSAPSSPPARARSSWACSRWASATSR